MSDHELASIPEPGHLSRLSRKYAIVVPSTKHFDG